MNAVKLLAGVGLISTVCFSTLAQSLVADRTTLNVLLDTYRVDEGFQNMPDIGNGAVASDGSLSSTSTNSWGPGHVVSGVTFESMGTNTYVDGVPYGNNYIQLNGDGFRGISSRTITAGLSLRVDFWTPTSAFGLDLLDYPAGQTISLAGITVYAADDTTVIYQNNSFSIPNTSSGLFFGFENTNGGIGSVVFSVTSPGPFDQGESPIIDNLSFGSSVPEPTTVSLAVVAAGALWWMRRRQRG
jgi:hypothetical protein